MLRSELPCFRLRSFSIYMFESSCASHGDLPLTIDAVFPPADPVVRRPILLVGDDLCWLAGRTELADRKIILADPGAELSALLAAEPVDAVMVSYSDVSKSLAVLRAADAAELAMLKLVRGDAREFAGMPCPYPVLPRVESVEILDDQMRTQLLVAAWQGKPALIRLLKQITVAPTLPAIYSQITAALQSPNVSIADVAELVARDPAVSAKLLQMVNSPLLRLQQRVTSIRDATSILGLDRLRSLVMASCLARQFDISNCRSFSMDRFEATSLRIANWASAIARAETRDVRVADMAFTAGLLHNFGVLLLSANIPNAYEEVLRSARERRVSLALREFQTFGATHAAIGGGFLASWRIPFPIINAVGWYPIPSASEDTAFSPLTAVHAATAVDAFAQTGMYAYDDRYMEKMGLCEKLEDWCVTLPEETLAA